MCGINWKYKLECATINLESRTEDEEAAALENCYLFNHSLLSVLQRTDLTSDKDLYLDNSSVEEASGVYPIDDDDYSSGSGSGETTCHKLIFKSVRSNAIIWRKSVQFCFISWRLYFQWILWVLCYFYRALGTPVGQVLSINFLLFSLTPQLHHFAALFSLCWLSLFPLISV